MRKELAQIPQAILIHFYPVKCGENKASVGKTVARDWVFGYITIACLRF